MTAPPTGDSDREALAVLLESVEVATDENGDGATLMPGPAARLTDAVLAAGFRRPATGDTEWFVRDANGRLHGPWSEEACRADVASGKGGVQVLCRRVTELMEVPLATDPETP